jgi:octaprenyl-diphosphate synthase
MRTQADLTTTADRLKRAADRGATAAATAERLSALETGVSALMARVEAALPALSRGGPGLAGQAAQHLIASGGKRVRPLITVLSARALGCRGPADDPRLESLALASELVHAATLLHDDVLDDGRVRRGMPAARVLWGNAASVLGGDFLLVRALELAASTGVEGALGDLLQAIGCMIDGEALQLAHRGRADLDASGYHAVVEGKTAALFAWCCGAGARLAGASAGDRERVRRYGVEVGRAFQIVDDVLDLDGDPAHLGKSVLNDLREGKLTLPVLHALAADASLRSRLAELGEAGEEAPPSLAEELRAAIDRAGATRLARQEAARATTRALEALADLTHPIAPYDGALQLIARELCARVS